MLSNFSKLNLCLFLTFYFEFESLAQTTIQYDVFLNGGRVIECLPEIVGEIKGRIPVLIDGEIRIGTDIFKALAMGENAVCIVRPFCWGLGALGQEGVEIALEILQAEFIRDMQLAGTTSIDKITSDFITRL